MAQEKDFTSKESSNVKEENGTAKSQNGSSRNKRSKKGRGGNQKNSGNNSKGMPRDSRSTQTPFGMSSVLLQNTANLFFSTPIGMGVDWAGNTDTSTIFNPSVVNDFTAAGIMVYDFADTPGISVDGSSAISTAMRDVFTYVCMFNSRTPSYGAADVIMYILAVKSLYTAHAMGVRTYGLLNIAVNENRYWPQRVIESLGWNYESIKEDMAKFRAYLNRMAFYINKFKIPKTVTLFDRGIELAMNIYSDANSTKSQLYAFNPVVFYRWAEAESETPNYLAAMASNNANQAAMNLGAYEELVDTLYTSISDSESCAIINSDIKRAYADVYEGPELLADLYWTMPQTDRFDILEGINNATVLNTNVAQQSYPISNFNITQQATSNVLLFNPTIPYASVSSGNNIPTLVASDQILNIRSNLPEPTDVVYGLQFVCFPYASKTAGSVQLTECSDVVLLRSRIFVETSSGLTAYSVPRYMLETASSTPTSGDVGATVSFFMDPLANLSQFDWHHPVTVALTDPGLGSAPTYVSPEFRDLDNYTVVTSDNVEPIHEAMLMGMLGITF